MRKRNIKKQVWLNKQEATDLRKKSKIAGMNESDFIRSAITNTVIKEKPDDRFYDFLKEMRHIGNNLNQIAKIANSTSLINASFYKTEYEKWNNFINKVKEEFL